MSQHGALMVIGSGPGVGSTTAATFASKGFKHILLLSRDPSRIQDDVKTVKSKANDVHVETLPIDAAGSEAELKSTFKDIDMVLEKWGVQLEVLLYNAARVGPSKPVSFPAETLATDLTINVTSLYITLQHYVPKLLQNSSKQKSTVLVSSGGLYKEPVAELFSLSAGKAAAHSLTRSMHDYYIDKGVNFGTVAVSGIISPDAKNSTPQAVADEMWKLYEGGIKEGKWLIEIDDPDYDEAVEGMRKAVANM